jgi:hypothetical protein
MLTEQEKEIMRKIGAQGGKKAASNMSDREKKKRARRAAQARWAKKKPK